MGLLMDRASIQEFAANKVLYLTTIGRRTGLPRQIEIWFVVDHGRFYMLAENRDDPPWVKNIRHNREVGVRVGDRQICATARVLDSGTDRELWDRVSEIADRKYGWGDGLPVEITPSPPSATSPDLTIKPGEDEADGERTG
jgi:deazaflavin-dependent oxidoreductase (nitroreductase family)